MTRDLAGGGHSIADAAPAPRAAEVAAPDALEAATGEAAMPTMPFAPPAASEAEPTTAAAIPPATEEHAATAHPGAAPSASVTAAPEPVAETRPDPEVPQPTIPRAFASAAPDHPTPPAATLSPSVIASLQRRGEEMLAAGDVTAARLLLGRAAAAGSGAAARAMGRTYDPDVLAALGAIGVEPDAEMAAGWYRRAAMLGDHDAAAQHGR